MIRTQVLTLDDLAWDSLIAQCHAYDFYHTRSYHKLETQGTQDEALLFVSYLGDNYIAFPLVIRAIEGTPYFDSTSVYGYCGPVSTIPLDRANENLIRNFQEALQEFFSTKNVISAFSRLHPLIASQAGFKSFGNIRQLNKTVAIDITIGLEAQRRQYRKSNKSELNQLRGRKGYIIKRAETDSEIAAFVDIYNETMERVNASKYYFFDLNYFKGILQNPNYEATILLALKDDKITAGAVFTIANTIMQYHLAGTGTSYIFDTPMKLILDEARLLANELRLDFLHLGGGVGGSDDDSLFRFKSGFSKSFFQFNTWQHILNESVYNDLVLKNGVSENDFFPLYRAPKL